MTTAYGHVQYSLSEMDVKMVESIPQGGNWRDIPISIPSKRLEQIRASGGRTTLYGRLQWTQPSYTITTYFNRPGNGCNIHPEENRVLTSLEAARLQSFPDSFRFAGTKVSRTKQIGNAVPPLLGYAIGKAIRSIDPSLNNVIDLFCGAGGLSLGLSWAGFATISANDNNKSALDTYRLNNPSVSVLEGDISHPATKSKIFESSKIERGVDLVVGGPPCQGFSMAGLRMIDDPRNYLYREFIQVVSEVLPKIVVMENVAGLLSSNGGETFRDIKENFRELGYSVEGRKLMAADYGVPQKRQRLIIIASRVGEAARMFPEPVLEKHSYLSVLDAIGDIPNRTTSDIEEPVYLSEPRSDYQMLMQGFIDADSYLTRIKTGS